MGVAERLMAAIGTARGDAPGGPAPAADDEVRAALDAHFEVILQEMRIPLSYVANQYPDAGMERLLLIGCGTELAGLEARLASRLDCQVRTVRPSDLCGAGREVDEDYGACLTVAVGLSEFIER